MRSFECGVYLQECATRGGVYSTAALIRKRAPRYLNAALIRYIDSTDSIFASHPYFSSLCACARERGRLFARQFTTHEGRRLLELHEAIISWVVLIRKRGPLGGGG